MRSGYVPIFFENYSRCRISIWACTYGLGSGSVQATNAGTVITLKLSFQQTSFKNKIVDTCNWVISQAQTALYKAQTCVEHDTPYSYY